MMQRKNQIIRKRILTAAFLLLFVLAGCGKDAPKEYVGESLVSTEDTDTSVKEEIPKNPADMLQVQEGDTIWELQTNRSVCIVQVRLPKDSMLYAQNFKAHYLTKEEKEQYLRYFLEEDSIAPDTENRYFPCRENLTQLIGDLEEYLVSIDEVMRTKEEGEEGEWLLEPYWEKELLRYQNALEDAPKKKEVAANANDGTYLEWDYTFYAGMRDGMEYSVDFASSKQDLESYVRVIPKDLTPFCPTEEFTYPRGNGTLHYTNECEMSVEDAEKEAERILEDLGITGLTVEERCAVAWDAYAVDGRIIRTVYDGYCFTFSRKIGEGSLVNSFCDIPMTADSPPLYDLEKCVIMLNDKGLMEFFYTGLLEPVEEASPVKLLTLENAKNVFADMPEVLSQSYFSEMELKYIRIKGQDADTYVILPAWSLGAHHVENSNYDCDQYIWINAMDGSKISWEAEGNVSYLTERYDKFITRMQYNRSGFVLP